MRKQIAFATPTNAPDPVTKSREAAFRDLTVKEEFRNAVIRFKAGPTWLRFLPSIQGSEYDWIMGVDSYQDLDGVTLVSPTTFDRNNTNLFEFASNWIRKNRQELIANKDTNPGGIRLWTKRTGLAWVIEEQAPEGERLRLFKGSLYDGARGGSTGLAYNIHLDANARDNEPNSPTQGELIHGNVTDPHSGRLIKIDKSAGTEYANYKIAFGKNPAPLEELLALLTDEEHDMICPLENVVHIPTEEEQRDALRRYLGVDLFSAIFGAQVVTTGGYTPTRPAAAAVATDEPVRTATPVAAPAAKPAPAPVAAAAPAPTPVAAPTPAPAVVEAAPAEDEAAKPYSIKDISPMLQTKEGLQELIDNRTRIPARMLVVVQEEAAEAGLVWPE